MGEVTIRVVILVLAAVVACIAITVQPAVGADSPACTAAKNQVALYQKFIARLNKQLPNSSASIQAVRKKQIDAQIKKDQASLAKAQALVKANCGPSVADFAGSYAGSFGNIPINFKVDANGVLSGDILSALGRPITAKSGAVDAKANFLDADCGTFKVIFDATAGTATTTLTCTLGGLTQGPTQVVANRK